MKCVWIVHYDACLGGNKTSKSRNSLIHFISNQGARKKVGKQHEKENEKEKHRLFKIN